MTFEPFGGFLGFDHDRLDVSGAAGRRVVAAAVGHHMPGDQVLVGAVDDAAGSCGSSVAPNSVSISGAVGLDRLLVGVVERSSPSVVGPTGVAVVEAVVVEAEAPSRRPGRRQVGGGAEVEEHVRLVPDERRRRSTLRIASMTSLSSNAQRARSSKAGQPAGLTHGLPARAGPRLVQQVVAERRGGRRAKRPATCAPCGGVAVLEADPAGPGSFAQKWSKARLQRRACRGSCAGKPCAAWRQAVVVDRPVRPALALEASRCRGPGGSRAA